MRTRAAAVVVARWSRGGSELRRFGCEPAVAALARQSFGWLKRSTETIPVLPRAAMGVV